MAKREIDLRKVEEANKLLQQIMMLVQQYDKAAKDLNPAESLLCGTLVAVINSEYSDHNLMATIGHQGMIMTLVDNLRVWIQNKMIQATQARQQPNLTPFTGGKIN